MKQLGILLSLLLSLSCGFGQDGELIENQARKFSIEQATDTIEFILVDTLLGEKKPIFLWCQGSLPLPLFGEIENYGNYFFGGGIVNFDYKEIARAYHLVIISMPKTPMIAKKEQLNSRFQYIPNPEEANTFSASYIKADYLENYVNRALAVLSFLKQQDWTDQTRLVVAGHSQGSKIATKIAVHNQDVTHLGLFAANPFGRIDQYVRDARLQAQLGKISWETADSLMNDHYAFYRQAVNKDSILADPSLKAWKTFSEPYYDDWLKLDIPIYLSYGTEDRTADLCDLVPLFFIEQGKRNLTLKRYIGLEHNFFEVDESGKSHHEKGHWPEVMNEFMQWVK